MRHRFVPPILFLFLLAGVPAAAQERRFASEVPRSGPVPSLPAPDSARGSWWSRNPQEAGALVGAVAGLAGWFAVAVNDPYCRDPDMFPCEIVAPFYVAAGAFVGWVVGVVIEQDDRRVARK